MSKIVLICPAGPLDISRKNFWPAMRFELRITGLTNRHK